MVSGGIATFNLDLGIGCWWVVSFVLWILHPQEKNPVASQSGGFVGPELVWLLWRIENRHSWESYHDSTVIHPIA